MRNRGFSLIEVMISMAILLVGLVGLAVAFQRSIAQTTSSRSDTSAMLIAQSILDELDGHSFQDIPTIVDTIGDEYQADFHGRFMSDPSSTDLYFTPTVVVTEANQNLIRLEIRVNWVGWRDEFDRGGYGKDTDATANAFVLNATISRNYGEQAIGAGS